MSPGSVVGGSSAAARRSGRASHHAPWGHQSMDISLKPLETCLCNRERETPTNYTFDEFELGNLALDLSLTPRQGQSCQHSGFVSIDTAYQPSKFRDLAQGDLFEPAI